MPDDEPLSPGAFDEVYAQVSAAPRANKLFDQVLGPFPPAVEPFSLVPRQGLDRVLRELQLGPGDHLVDLCCGRGGIGLWFASVSGACLTGVDFSSGAIAEARRRTQLFVPGSLRASFVVADAADTSLPAHTVDALVCIDALQLVSDKNGLLREIARLLRPGGRAVITTWERSTDRRDLPSSFSIADAGALAEAAGLHVLVREEHADWLERQRAFYEQVIAADGDSAEPALRLLAEEGRAMLPCLALARRLLLVTST